LKDSRKSASGSKQNVGISLKKGEGKQKAKKSETG
jgi:hypothetical protein